MKHYPKSDFQTDEKVDDTPQKGAKPEFSYSAKLAFMSSVIRHPKMTLAGVRAADVVTDMHNHKLGYCWPSIDTMAERMGMSRSTVKAAVALLVDLGFLTKETARHQGHQGANHYRPLYAEAAARGQSTGPSNETRGQSTGYQRPNPRPARGQSAGSPEVSPSPPNQGDGTRMNNKDERTSSASGEAGSLDCGRPEVAAKPAKVPLPDDLAFTVEAIAAAKAPPRNLDDDDIRSAMSSFRHAVLSAPEQNDRAPGTWDKATTSWLGSQKARPKGTKPKIIPERPRDPTDADGTLFDRDAVVEAIRADEVSCRFAADVPEGILRKANSAFFERYQDEASGGARSSNWPSVWRTTVQHAWDVDKAAKASSKYPPSRPAI